PRQFFALLNDGNNPYETQISASNVAQLDVACASPVDGQVDGRAGPLVVNGTVYVGTRSRVYAINASTGQRRWSFRVGTDSTVTGLARWNNLVYATDVLDHRIYAIDAATGKEVWHLASEVGTTGPTVIGDVLL